MWRHLVGHTWSESLQCWGPAAMPEPGSITRFTHLFSDVLVGQTILGMESVWDKWGTRRIVLFRNVHTVASHLTQTPINILVSNYGRVLWSQIGNRMGFDSIGCQGCVPLAVKDSIQTNRICIWLLEFISLLTSPIQGQCKEIKVGKQINLWEFCMLF